MKEKQSDIDSFHIPVGRSVDELRRSRGVIIASPERTFAFLPVESLHPAMYAALPIASRQRVVITGARAKSIGLTTDADAVAIDAADLSLEQIRFLADPLCPTTPLPALITNTASAQEKLALVLAKYASLLPAVLIIDPADSLSWQKITTEAIEHYMRLPIIDIDETAQARLPLASVEQVRIKSFRQRHGTSVHLALMIGDIVSVKEPLVRIHSSCITGDILGSLRCDCGDQLQLALSQISQEGAGLLLYLHQEGRGIGITNKIRAYALQEQGVDTYDANLMLGFAEDERDFSIAAAILKKLSATRIQLLTNNPHKIKALEAHGILVAKRLPLVVKTGAHNHDYLAAKVKKSGHLF